MDKLKSTAYIGLIAIVWFAWAIYTARDAIRSLCRVVTGD